MAASAQYGQTTYLPSTIPNIDVWPLGGEQYDGIDLDTCLKKAQARGFHFASYTAGRLPLNSRCNLYTQSTTAAVGGVSYNTDWDLYAVNAPQYGQTTYLPSTIPNTDVWPLGGEQYDGIDLDTCLKKAQTSGFHFASYTAHRLPINSRCNLYTQTTTAAVGGVSYNTDWDLYAVNTLQYGQTTYLPSTIPNTDVWPLSGEQYDGIDLDTCLKKAQTSGFHFASYTAGRLPVNSRCNLYTQSTTAAVGGVTYNTDWELIAVEP